MGNAPVDEVDFFDAAFEGFKGGFDFRNHAAGDGAVLDELTGLDAGDGFDEGGLVLGIAQKAWNIGKVNKLGGLEGAGQGRGCDVGIDVVSFSGVLVSAQR